MLSFPSRRLRLGLIVLVGALAMMGCSLNTDIILGAEPGDAGGDADGGGDSAVPTDSAADTSAMDSAVDGAVDGGVDSALPDTGPPAPTDIIETPGAGTFDGHPAVLFDGSEFVVGLIDGSDVELVYMAPGDVTALRREQVSTMSHTNPADVALATDGAGRLAVGWTAEVAGRVDLFVRVLPEDSAEASVSRDIYRDPDHEDAALYHDGSAFAAITRRQSFGGSTELAFGALGASSPATIASNFGSLGDFDVRPSALGPLLTLGRGPAAYRFDGASWPFAFGPTGIFEGTEGSSAALPGGAIGSVWLHTPPLQPRRLSWVRTNTTPFVIQDGAPRDLSYEGADPTLAAIPDGALMAFVYNDDVDRTLGLVAFGGDGSVLAGPCRAPRIEPHANDPDIACAGAWCAVAWIEGPERNSTEFVTRVMQVPSNPTLLCP